MSLHTLPEFVQVTKVLQTQEDWLAYNELVFARRVLSKMIYGV
jgi:acyl carrier protein phosphodiesterase